MSSSFHVTTQHGPVESGGKASAPVSPQAAAGSRGKVLLVDDEPLVGQTLGLWLRKLGYDAPLASSPAEADRLLAAASFDLLLTDVNMPGNFRLEWIENLLSRPAIPPILLITGTPDLETACRAANLPIAGYLLKPLDFDTLDSVIQGVLQEHRPHREFVRITQDIIHLLTARRSGGSPEADALVARLTLLSSNFRTPTPRVAADRATDEAWRTTISDTIAVIEKTKHSFRSKELGQLRLRLQQMLIGSEAV